MSVLPSSYCCSLVYFRLLFSVLLKWKEETFTFFGISPPYTCCRSKPTSKKNNRYSWHHSSKKKTVWKKYCRVLPCAISHDCTLPAAWPYTADVAEPSGFSLQTPALSRHLRNWKQKDSQLDAQIPKWGCRCSMERRVKLSCIRSSLRVHLGS